MTWQQLIWNFRWWIFGLIIIVVLYIAPQLLYQVLINASAVMVPVAGHVLSPLLGLGLTAFFVIGGFKMMVDSLKPSKKK